jgi:type IV pilus assembly protein PilW
MKASSASGARPGHAAATHAGASAVARRPASRPPGRAQRGISLVELMVGIAVSLLVVAAAATLVAHQLADNRRLIVETQLQQDLRASLDLITRQLRRAGGVSAAAAQAVLPGTGGQALPGPGGQALPDRSADGAVDPAHFGYTSSAIEASYGFRLDGGVIQARLGNSGWQDLTDGHSLKVTALAFTPTTVSSAPLPCPKLCSDGSARCWPTLVVRDLVVQISATATTDPTVRRSLGSRVRVRNDWLRFNEAAHPHQACPA